jgi:hypothetical protein
MQDLLQLALTMLGYFVLFALLIGGVQAGTVVLRWIRQRIARPRQVSLVKAGIHVLPVEGERNRYATHVVVENTSPHPVSNVHVIRALGYSTTRVPIDWREPVLGPGSRVVRKIDSLEHVPGYWFYYEITFTFIDVDGRRWRRTGSSDPRRNRLPKVHEWITVMMTSEHHAA